MSIEISFFAGLLTMFLFIDDNLSTSSEILLSYPLILGGYMKGLLSWEGGSMKRNKIDGEIVVFNDHAQWCNNIDTQHTSYSCLRGAQGASGV